MEVNQDTIQHLAELSNFALTVKETDSLVNDIQEILGYISKLDELNTDGIEPTYQVFEMENVWRKDKIQAQDANPEELLALTQIVEQQQIKIPQVL